MHEDTFFHMAANTNTKCYSWLLYVFLFFKLNFVGLQALINDSINKQSHPDKQGLDWLAQPPTGLNQWVNHRRPYCSDVESREERQPKSGCMINGLIRNSEQSSPHQHEGSLPVGHNCFNCLNNYTICVGLCVWGEEVRKNQYCVSWMKTACLLETLMQTCQTHARGVSRHFW